MSRNAQLKTPEQAAEAEGRRLGRKALYDVSRREEDFEAVGLQPTASHLDQHDGVVIQRAGRKNVLRARRTDVFDDLRAGMGDDAYAAARRFERDLALRAGERDAPSGNPVDNSGRWCRQDIIIAAAERVEAAKARLDTTDFEMLEALMRPEKARGLSRWTEIVAAFTSAAQHAVLCDRVRGACLRLARAYG